MPHSDRNIIKNGNFSDWTSDNSKTRLSGLLEKFDGSLVGGSKNLTARIKLNSQIWNILAIIWNLIIRLSVSGVSLLRSVIKPLGGFLEKLLIRFPSNRLSRWLSMRCVDIGNDHGYPSADWNAYREGYASGLTVSPTNGPDGSNNAMRLFVAGKQSEEQSSSRINLSQDIPTEECRSLAGSMVTLLVKYRTGKSVKNPISARITCSRGQDAVSRSGPPDRYSDNVIGQPSTEWKEMRVAVVVPQDKTQVHVTLAWLPPKVTSWDSWIELSDIRLLQWMKYDSKKSGRGDLPEDIIFGPTREIPPHLLDHYTMDGKVTVIDREDRWFDESESDDTPKIWTQKEFDGHVQRVLEAQKTKGSVGYDDDGVLHDQFKKYPFAGKEVLVIGSWTPQYEAFIYANGGKPVTVEYQEINCLVDGVKTYTLEEFEDLNMKFDFMLSVSSIEHSGLGRYGDPLDPDGDYKAMDFYSRFMNKGGIYFFQVPAGPKDILFWNAHRVYGPARLPGMLKNFDVLEQYRDDDIGNTYFVLKQKF